MELRTVVCQRQRVKGLSRSLAKQAAPSFLGLLQFKKGDLTVLIKRTPLLMTYVNAKLRAALIRQDLPGSQLRSYCLPLPAASLAWCRGSG
jgi:hypothetical protein